MTEILENDDYYDVTTETAIGRAQTWNPDVSFEKLRRSTFNQDEEDN